MPRLYQATPGHQETPPRRTAPRVTFTVLAAAAAAFALMQSLVTPVLPTIQQDLHTTTGTVTWVLTAWLLAASVATPLMGRIADMIGKDRTLLVALGAIALGCLLAAIAPNVTVLIVARVVQGLGAAVFPVSFGIIRDIYPPNRVSSAIGILAAVIASGSGLGIVLAGPIVGWLDWRWLFWIPMVAVTLVAVAAWRVVPPSPTGVRGRINWLSAVLLAGWLVALLLPLSKGATWGWANGRTLGLFALALVFFAGWMATELRSAEPLIDMRMMRLPAVWTTNLVSMLFGAAMFGVFAFLPQLMQVPASTGYGFGASVTGAGLLMLPMMVTMAVFGSVSGPLTRWVSNKVQLLIGAGLGTLSALSLALAHDSRAMVAVTGAVFGVGLGLLYSSMINLIVQSVPMNQTGVASGMNTNIRTIGASIGTAVVSSVVTGHTGPQGLPAESGYTEAFLLLAVASALAFLVALLVPAGRRKAAPETPVALPELTPVEV